MKKFVLVGVGGRSLMFTDALAGPYKTTSKLVAICDLNRGRLLQRQRQLAGSGVEVECYDASEFDRMIREQRPDVVIVCTKDSMHDEYICRSMALGCDVITEKPMTTDAAKCQKIVDTVKRTGKQLRVTFNYRYSPPRTQIKKLLMEGVIGEVLSVEFKWMLDPCHGADYFRRWHRHKANSGGLMVHKATHHFDLVNWWIGSRPQAVSAKGDRLFYNERQAARYGLQKHGRRCLDCPVRAKCNFYLDMAAFDTMKKLYLDQESHDGYERDRCVFSDDIDIEDTMNVIVAYKNNVFMSYSLNAFSAWEGYHIAFNGTKGRLEQHCEESSYVSGDDQVQGGFQPEGTWIRLYPHFRTPYNIEVDEGKGAHGGGDTVMLEDIFGKGVADPYKRNADYVQGAYSILTGIAANLSMGNQQNIIIDELVSGLPEPDLLVNPSSDQEIEYVANTTRMSKGKPAEANVPMDVSAPE